MSVRWVLFITVLVFFGLGLVAGIAVTMTRCPA